jgi:DNA-binding transcriptional LysR family regulator
MDIHHLRIFVSVFQNKSFSKASDQLYLSQPTISEHIKNMEIELECKLFDRVGRTILPTQEAEALYPRTMQILDEMSKLKQDLLPFEREVKGPLIIGASTIPGTYILPVMAVEFKDQHENVSFQIIIEDSKKISDRVLNHEILLGIVGAVMEPEKISYVPFVEDELILAASPDVIKNDTIGIKDLVSVPFVLREEGSGTRKTMEKFLEQKKLTVQDLRVVGILGSTDSVKQALKAGLGASILSRISVKDEIDAGRLREIKIRGFRMTRNFYLIFHKKRSLPNPYGAFVKYLTDKSKA